MREKYQTRKILLAGNNAKQSAINLINNAPIDDKKSLEFILREEVKIRKDTQNALMWSGALKDIAEQAWLDGRQYSIDVWHIFFKETLLPEEFDADLCKEGYQKWSYLPNGERRLTGSTTNLTVKGFAEYLTQVYAFGADLGVLFKTKDYEHG